jgi:hypothetical protein
MAISKLLPQGFQLPFCHQLIELAIDYVFGSFSAQFLKHFLFLLLAKLGSTLLSISFAILSLPVHVIEPD